MKAILFTALPFLLLTQFSFGQWYSQDIFPYGNDLNAVKFISSTTGWAVGNSGIIIRTTNGGINWTQEISGTYNRLYGVSFTDETTGTAVGQKIILRTTNGGITWYAQRQEPRDLLSSVSFTDTNNGTAVGFFSKILRTTNGGITWFEQPGSSQNLWGVSFTNENVGTAVGSEGLIIRTTNGGTTWTEQTSGTGAWLWGFALRTRIMVPWLAVQEQFFTPPTEDQPGFNGPVEMRDGYMMFLLSMKILERLSGMQYIIQQMVVLLG